MTARPDVLIDVTPLALGSRYQGIGAYIVQLTKAIALLTDEERGGLAVAALADWRGGRPLVAPLAEAADAVGEWPGAAYSDRGFVWRRRRELGAATRRAGARLLHLPEPLGMPLFPGCPRVVTCHDLIPLLLADVYSRRPRLARLRAFALEWPRAHFSRRIIAVSETTKRDLVRHLGVQPRRIAVVPHGVDADRFNERAAEGERETLRARYGLPARYVLHVGTADRRKGIPTLVAAFAARAPEPTGLVLAGRIFPPQRPAVERAIAAHDAAGRVFLLDHVPDDDLPALYRQATAFVFPSRYEGFGLPLLEAFACGAPAVAAANPALLEVGGDAFLAVPVGDEAALGEAIARVLGDAALRGRLVAAGKRRAARFTWRAAALGAAAVYRDVLAGR